MNRAEPAPGSAEIRLLGEPSFLAPGGVRRRLESAAGRLLLAYLADHPGQAVPRGRLALLLWPDEPGARALHNLRQALYDLRRALATDAEPGPIVSDRRTATFVPRPDCWLDWPTFETLAGLGLSKEGSAAALEQAAALYRGPFLAGIPAPADEELLVWLLRRQEALRETALAVLDALVAHHLRRGEHARALHRARRLADLDPQSDHAQRQLLQLAVAAGERGDLVDHDDPTITPARSRRRDGESQTAGTAPLLPLAGPPGLLDGIVASGAAAFTGPARTLTVAGPPGSGRSRLVHTALAELFTNDRRGHVLRAGSPYLSGLIPWAGARELLASLPPQAGPPGPAEVPGPHWPWQDPSITGSVPCGGMEATHEGLVTRLAATFTHLVRRRPLVDPVPLAVVIDDGEDWDEGSLRAVGAAVRRVASLPLWLVVVHRAPEPPSVVAAAGLPCDRFAVPALAPRHVLEASRKLVGSADGVRLGEWLARHAGGLPLEVVEAVRLLADQGSLDFHASRWHLVDLPQEPPADLSETVARRVALLPTSSRHLLELASAGAPRVEVALLAAAADEHPAVVDVALGLLIERGFLRHATGPWKRVPGPHDPELWQAGARHGRLEIAHPTIASAVLDDLDAGEVAGIAGALSAAAADLDLPQEESDALVVRPVGAHRSQANRVEVLAAMERLARRATAAGDPWTRERLVEGMKAAAST